MIKRITSRASAPIQYGMFVMLNGDECEPDPTLNVGGVACRPSVAIDDRGYRIGAEVIVQTDGDILADFGGGSIWIKLSKGRIV